MIVQFVDGTSKAREAWRNALPRTAMTILRDDCNYTSSERYRWLLRLGVSAGDALDFASDYYLRPLDDTGGE